jgi:hypothetical protein
MILKKIMGTLKSVLRAGMDMPHCLTACVFLYVTGLLHLTDRFILKTPRVRFAKDNSYRMLFPFFLIIIVFLLLVFRLVLPTSSRAPEVTCPSGSTASMVVTGDTCWDIAVAHGCKLDELLKLNPAVDCEKLRPGQSLCVPI